MSREYIGAVGWCPAHRKHLHNSRKRARQAARAAHPGHQMRAYQCTQYPGHWHYGHLPAVVRFGTATADEVYGRGAA